MISQPLLQKGRLVLPTALRLDYHDDARLALGSSLTRDKVSVRITLREAPRKGAPDTPFSIAPAAESPIVIWLESLQEPRRVLAINSIWTSRVRPIVILSLSRCLHWETLAGR